MDDYYYHKYIKYKTKYENLLMAGGNNQCVYSKSKNEVINFLNTMASGYSYEGNPWTASIFYSSADKLKTYPNTTICTKDIKQLSNEYVSDDLEKFISNNMDDSSKKIYSVGKKYSITMQNENLTRFLGQMAVGYASLGYNEQAERIYQALDKINNYPIHTNNDAVKAGITGPPLALIDNFLDNKNLDSQTIKILNAGKLHGKFKTNIINFLTKKTAHFGATDMFIVAKPYHDAIIQLESYYRPINNFDDLDKIGLNTKITNEIRNGIRNF